MCCLFFRNSRFCELDAIYFYINIWSTCNYTTTINQHPLHIWPLQIGSIYGKLKSARIEEPNWWRQTTASCRQLPSGSLAALAWSHCCNSMRSRSSSPILPPAILKIVPVERGRVRTNLLTYQPNLPTYLPTYLLTDWPTYLFTLFGLALGSIHQWANLKAA